MPFSSSDDIIVWLSVFAFGACQSKDRYPGRRGAGVDTFILLYLERLGVRKLEAFFGILVATMTVSFGVMYFMAECPTEQVIVGTLLPSMRCALQTAP